MKPKTIAIGMAIGLAVAVVGSTSGVALTLEQPATTQDATLKDWVHSDSNCDVTCAACFVEGFVLGLSCPGPGSWVECGPDPDGTGCICDWGCI